MATPRRLAHCLFLLHVSFIANAFVIQSKSLVRSRGSPPSLRRPPESWLEVMAQLGRGATTRTTVRNRATSPTALRLSSSSSSSTPPSSSLPDVEGMKIGEIRSELESYGISTKTFLEKKEMVAELVKARAEGKRPVKSAAAASSSGASATSSTKQQSAAGSTASSTQSASSRGAGSSKATRDERVKEEMAKASSMGVADLKKELTRMGVSTKSFFEKSEFVKAYAEAVVDGVGVNGNVPNDDAEPYDPEYRDVVMQKMGRSDPRLLQGTVIDVSVKRR